MFSFPSVSMQQAQNYVLGISLCDVVFCFVFLRLAAYTPSVGKQNRL